MRETRLDKSPLLGLPPGFADREHNEHTRPFEQSRRQVLDAFSRAIIEAVYESNLLEGPGGRSQRLVNAGKLPAVAGGAVRGHVAQIDELAQWTAAPWVWPDGSSATTASSTRMFFSTAPTAVRGGYGGEKKPP